MSLALALLIPFCAPAARAADTPMPKGIEGVWLFDAAALKQTELPRVWESVVTIGADGFGLSKPMGAKGDLKGTLSFDAKDPRALDLKVSELDLSELLPGYKVPAGTLHAIYALDGDRLTICFPSDYKGSRPQKFEANANTFLATLARAPKDFKGLPKEVAVAVTGPDGKPAAGVTVAQSMWYNPNTIPKTDTKPGWEYHDPVTTAADGTAVLECAALRSAALVARDPGARLMAVVAVSPAKLATGRLSAKLAPEVRVAVPVTCDELTKAGQPLGHVNGHLLADGRRFTYHASKDGRLEFLAPPGRYTLWAYGSEVTGKRYVDVVVPEGCSEFAVEPVAMPALPFALMRGKPAPELDGVVGWAGAKTTFADLKGKYVLVEFWGYWCGPCIESMPALIELHERYADKGVAIVGVHIDVDGEVDSAAKLAARVKGYQKEHWKGKAIPFPVALASGARSGDNAERGGPVAQYGIGSYPTCLLIDREGKVVGVFDGARDARVGTSIIERLLKEKK